MVKVFNLATQQELVYWLAPAMAVVAAYAQEHTMTQYTIAYKNNKTEDHAEKTGNLAGGWVRVYAWSSREDTLNIFKGMVNRGQYKGSILGVFVSHDNDKTAWYDRSPRFAHDTRDKSDWKISGLEGLINSRSSADL